MNNVIGGGPKTPWHLWVVGVLTLLWNAVGATSYTMTRLGMLEQLGMGETEIAFFESAGGAFPCRQVIDRLERFYRKRKVQPS